MQDPSFLKSFIKPLRLGSLTLSSNIAYAPLAGCSDFPFRKMSNLFRPGLFFCEMVKIDALVRNDRNTFHLLDYSEDMHPLGAQLCGSNPKLIAPAARMIEELGFDVVDLNCGCPVDKVTKDGSGSGLLKNPEKIGELLSNMIAAVKIPVTLKIRVGWDEENIVAPQITKIAEEAGAKAIFVHGRTRAQAYKGPANYERIKECTAVRKNLLVFGNGDILCEESAQRCFVETGVDGILVARGTLGAPWVFEEILNAFLGEPKTDYDLAFLKKTFRQHFTFIKDYQSKQRTIIELRKVGSWYLRDRPETKSLREQINRLHSLEDVEAILAQLG